MWLYCVFLDNKMDIDDSESESMRKDKQSNEKYEKKCIPKYMEVDNATNK